MALTELNETAEKMYDLLNYARTHNRRIQRHEIDTLGEDAFSHIKALISLEYLKEVKKDDVWFYSIRSKGLNLFDEKRLKGEISSDEREDIIKKLENDLKKLRLKPWEVMLQILQLLRDHGPMNTEEIFEALNQHFPEIKGTYRSNIYRWIQRLRMKGYLEYDKKVYTEQSSYKLGEAAQGIMGLSSSRALHKLRTGEEWDATMKQVLKKREEEDVLDVAIKRLSDEQIDVIFDRIKDKEEELREFLRPGKTINKNENFFLVLRRWNSFTPALPRENEEYITLGGGYFISWQGKGIVIDPGFNFIDNLKKEGFKFDDIDMVFVTHDHQDHTNDIERILTLLYEYNDLNKRYKKSIKFYMNRSSLLKYIHLFIAKNDLKSLTGIYHNEKHIINKNTIIEVKKAFHEELMGSEFPVGLLFKLKDNNKSFNIALPSDTSWNKKLITYYNNQDIQLLIVHMGTITEEEFFENKYYQKHLGYLGSYQIIKNLKPKIAIISEFGEELLHSRIDIVKALEEGVEGITKCFAGDIGLKVEIPSLEIWCEKRGVFDGHYCNFSNMKQRYLGEKIIYRCKNHDQYS